MVSGSRTDFARLLRERTHEQMSQPHDFGAALDALRFLREMSLHPYLEFKDWLAVDDRLAVIEQYIYDRATPAEVHARSLSGQHRGELE